MTAHHPHVTTASASTAKTLSPACVIRATRAIYASRKSTSANRTHASLAAYARIWSMATSACAWLARRGPTAKSTSTSATATRVGIVQDASTGLTGTGREQGGFGFV